MTSARGEVSPLVIISPGIHCCFCGKQTEKLISVCSDEALEYDIPAKIEMYLPVKLTTLKQSECCRDCIFTILAWHDFVQKALVTSKQFNDFSTKQEWNGNKDTDSCLRLNLKPSPTKINFQEESTNQSENHFTKLENDDLEDSPSNFLDKEDQEKCLKLESNDQDDVSYVCNFCPQIFPSEEEVLNHTNETHPDATENEVPTKKGSKRIRTKIDLELINAAKVVVDNRMYYSCKECGKSLLSPYTFMWHMRIHTGERPFICDLCGKQFRVSQGLVRHLKETHQQIKNFSCDICGRMFATKRNVDEHRRIHTNERPYICALCGKSFKQKASLFVHNRIHSDTFPYKCDYCNQGFRAKPPLLIHLTKHTGQKPYPCDVCGRYFRIKYELKRHKLVHSEEKPFCCSCCGMRFKQKRYLLNHFKSNHMNN